MNKFLKYLILSSCFLLSSCTFLNNNKNEKKEKKFENVYNLTEAWSTDVESIFQVWKPLQIDNFLYIMEDGFEDYGYNDNYDQFHYVKKIDLKNGNVVGTSKNFDNNIKTDLFIYDDFLYFFAEENNIIFLDKDSLNIIKIIKIGLEQYSYNYHCKILQYKDNLIWGNNSNADKKNMIMVNVPELFAMENGEEYIPKILYTQANGNAVDSYAIEGEILYFLTTDWLLHGGEDTCTLYAYNIETKETLWKKEFPTITGTMHCSIQIIDDNLYVIEKNMYCFNKLTGKEIWKKEQTEEDKYKEVICAAESILPDLAICDNKVYFTGYFSEIAFTTSKYPKENIKNLFCYDLKNGKYVWGDLIYGTGNLDSIPLIRDDKLFISTFSCFRIYDKDSGKLLGDYPNYCNEEADIVFYYDNKYIFFDCHDMKGRYVAVTISEK